MPRPERRNRDRLANARSRRSGHACTGAVLPAAARARPGSSPPAWRGRRRRRSRVAVLVGPADDDRHVLEVAVRRRRRRASIPACCCATDCGRPSGPRTGCRRSSPRRSTAPAPSTMAQMLMNGLSGCTWSQVASRRSASQYRRGMPPTPRMCIGKNVQLAKMNVSAKCTLPHVSFIIRPNIFGNQK